jgi:cytochrome P450
MTTGDPDPYGNYAWLREHAPVSPLPSASGTATTWLVTSYEHAKACLVDTRLSNDARHGVGVAPDPTADDHDLLATDAPHHTRLRKLAASAFGPRAVEALRPRIERLCAETVAQLAGRAEADLVADYTVPIPVAVIHEVLGIPEHARKAPDRCMDLFFRASLTQPRDAAAARELEEYLDGLIALKRARPGDDLTTKLLGDLDRGDILHEGELRSLLFALVGAGHTTTIPLLGAAVLRLLQHPDALAEVLADPARWRGCVDEALRYDSPVQASVNRYATSGMTLGAAQVGQGDTVLVSLAAANRDPAWFAEPDRFRPDRDPKPHLAFGQGAHFCLGAPLARVEAEIALRALFEGLPGIRLLVDPARVPWTGGPMLRGPGALPVALRAR